MKRIQVTSPTGMLVPAGVLMVLLVGQAVRRRLFLDVISDPDKLSAAEFEAVKSVPPPADAADPLVIARSRDSVGFKNGETLIVDSLAAIGKPSIGKFVVLADYSGTDRDDAVAAAVSALIKAVPGLDTGALFALLASAGAAMPDAGGDGEGEGDGEGAAEGQGEGQGAGAAAPAPSSRPRRGKLADPKPAAAPAPPPGDAGGDDGDLEPVGDLTDAPASGASAA